LSITAANSPAEKRPVPKPVVLKVATMMSWRWEKEGERRRVTSMGGWEKREEKREAVFLKVS
jgi:hypothetical protein